MTQKRSKSNLFGDNSDMFNKFSDFKNMSDLFDKEKIMKSHRKNIEALTEANKMAVDVLKSLAQLQSQYMKKSFEDMTNMIQGSMKTGDKANPTEKHATAIKGHIDRTLEHSQAITSTLAQSHRDIYQLFHNRMTSGVKEAKESTEALKKKFK
jgi:phasin family protein